MKRKQIFAGLLVGFLCACTLPILTFAEDETWIDLDQSTVTDNTLTNGNYRLVGDIEIAQSLTIPKQEEVTLDLNSYTITETGNVPVIEIEMYGSLTLLDSSDTQTGTITGGKGASNQGGGVYNNSGTFTMEGGNITGNDAGSGSGGGVYTNGTFTMNGGAITGNNYSTNSNGGGVYVAKNSTFTMNGGIISENKISENGGGVCVAEKSTFTMNGGAIIGNEIVEGNNNYSGGGVFIDSNGQFIMTDGIIAENQCLTNDGKGGGVCNHYGTFTMTGGTITGNQAKNGGGVYNYNLGSSATFSPTDADISIYANTATTAPDIYNMSGGYLTLSATVNQNLPDYNFLGWYDSNSATAYTPTGSKDSSQLYLEAQIEEKPHEHTLEYINEVAPTCTEDGYQEYYHCERCDTYFTVTENGEIGDEITAEKLVIPALGHELENLDHIDALAPTCTEDGYQEYYYCAQCDTYFTVTENGEIGDEITAEELVISALGHELENLDHIDALAPTCTEDGNPEYYYCERCGTYFAVTENGEIGNEITAEKLVISAPGHDLERIAAVAPTCTEDGYQEYYYCERCGTYFAAEDGEIGDEIAAEDLVISALGHDFVRIDAVDPTYESAGNIEYWRCKRCGVCFSDENGENKIAYNDTIRDQLVETTESTVGVTETSETSKTTESTAGVTTETSETSETTESTAGVTETSDNSETTESTADVTETSETSETTESTADVTETSETSETTESTADVTETSETSETTESTANVTETSETSETTESTADVTETSETSETTESTAGVTMETSETTETTESTAGVTMETSETSETTESTAGVTMETSETSETTESTADVTTETSETTESEESSICYLFGDVDFDGNVTPTDSYLCLVAYASAQLGCDIEWNELQQFVADVNGDGTIDPTDAYYILVYYATEQIRGAVTWEEIIDAWESIT